MTEEKNHSTFAVAIEPVFDEDNKWTGVVSGHIEEQLADDLCESELTQLRMVCGMLATCLQLLEAEEEFLEYVQDTFFSMNKEVLDELLDLEERTPNYTKEGNVLTLNFNTKTHGNA